MHPSFRLIDFTIFQDKNEDGDSNTTEFGDKNRFGIQMFGINEKGETCSIIINDYKPFFYVKVPDSWNIRIKDDFVAHIKDKVGKYYENSIVDTTLIKRKKLNMFDGGLFHQFIVFKFNNTGIFNKVKNMWYADGKMTDSGYERRLLNGGYKWNGHTTELYESFIPPLLRYFHVKKISPSGWITFKRTPEKVENKITTCTFEYVISEKDIKPLPEKETIVPYKICSFDIEASSSHGDFPLPTKTYKRLAINIVEYWNNNEEIIVLTQNKAALLENIIYTAFGYSMIDGIDKIYTKRSVSKATVYEYFNKWVSTPIAKIKDNGLEEDQYDFEDIEDDGDVVENTDINVDQSQYNHPAYGIFNKKTIKKCTNVKYTVIDLLCDDTYDRESKIIGIDKALCSCFPAVEGDKVTFIGSTFMKYGELEPYFNHCIALDTCDKVDDAHIDAYQTEKEVLLAWTNLIQKENPDIIIGYNIFGFDYKFLYNRANENDCLLDFLKLSRNCDELCGTEDYKTGKIKIEESTTRLASGDYNLHYIKMNGRLQIDMYNYFRRDYNLPSYKLDFVSSYFIGDTVKSIVHDNNITIVKSKNLKGLRNGNFISFEESSHSTDMYKNGKKFEVFDIDNSASSFKVQGIEQPNMEKSVKWCLAKDDVSPQDIFRMTNEGPTARAKIAKYCIQDCNLVHHLINKIDVITGYVEMANICSVPIAFLVFRGQGIKLTSYIAKKCREKKTLMPVLDKSNGAEGYEGAIVLPPKCDLYINKPVACVDYSSLYPSSMISENISHDSKVWTKEYDLDDNLIKIEGDRDKNGKFIYDNLDDYEYRNIEYNVYSYKRKNTKAAATKTCVGKKICRFAQFPEGKAIMPSILQELLAARKSTRKLIKTEEDEFMKNILDKRQLSYKLTANSLYGQCGAKTSTFYEVDVAASTTAIGRKLLIYGKNVIEEVYKNKICETSFGTVRTRSEYIYGDTDSVFFTFNLEEPLSGEAIIGKMALKMTIELAKEAGELATSCLGRPHDLEYEKTLLPFLLMSKKRYVGMQYEEDPDVCYRKSMGIVLKRRDNADIVKDVYGGIIDILMKEQNVDMAIEFLKSSLQDVIDGNIPIDKLIITKSLRSDYKNPKQIAHKVLADRIGKRDPGNKPSPGDRMAYVYYKNDNKKSLQGDKIETVDFIKSNCLEIDYPHYISNQIMKPVQQVFALVLEQIPDFKKKLLKARRFKLEETSLFKEFDLDVANKKVETLRNKEVKVILFDKYLQADSMRGTNTLMGYFK